MSPDPTPATLPAVAKQNPKFVAAATLEAAFARDETTEEVKAAVAAESIWCYSCDRKRNHFGIFFVGDPREKNAFGPGDWYSVYHDNREVFDFEHDEIVCQQCYAETGERVFLRLGKEPSPDRKAGAFFRIKQSWMERFAFEVKRKDMEAWLAAKKKKTEAQKELASARK
jgi:hypothetical protein